MSERTCIRCRATFEPIPSVAERMKAAGREQRVCGPCVLIAIDEMADDEAMSDEEIDVELRKAGIDAVASAVRLEKLLREHGR